MTLCSVLIAERRFISAENIFVDLLQKNFLQKIILLTYYCRIFCSHYLKNNRSCQADLSAALVVFLRQCRTVARSSAMRSGGIYPLRTEPIRSNISPGDLWFSRLTSRDFLNPPSKPPFQFPGRSHRTLPANLHTYTKGANYLQF